MRIAINPSRVQGSLKIPSSKSQTLRALLFARLAHGTSTLHNLLDSDDTRAMLKALKLERGERVEGWGGQLQLPSHIDVDNSGLVLRLLGALAATQSEPIHFTGSASIRMKRPLAPLLTAIRQLGGAGYCSLLNEHPPCAIRGPIHPGHATLPGADSQPVSAMLIAASFLKGTTSFRVTNPGEKPWIELTLDWLRRLGGEVEHDNYLHYRVKGPLKYDGFTYTVPGDFSSAAFPCAAALITGGEVRLEGLDFDDPQGDKKVLPLLTSLSHFEEATLDLNNMIDALPILSVVGCFAKGKTELRGAAIARKKESDRISAIATELRKMGASIKEHEDGLTLYHSPLKGAALHSHDDHRIAMALIVAALGAEGSSTIDTTCIKKTFPNFVEAMQTIGADLCPT